MSHARLKQLFANSLDASPFKQAATLSDPPTWGVYRVSRGNAQVFYKGNHPARLRELQRIYGNAELVAPFATRVDAEELAYLLNGQRRRP
jgi:hypothetical protein